MYQTASSRSIAISANVSRAINLSSLVDASFEYVAESRGWHVDGTGQKALHTTTVDGEIINQL
jgi:hypothetical protein